MSDDTFDDRLTLLERAQLLHNATLRRQGELLDRHEARMDALAANLIALREIQDRQQGMLEALTTLAGQHQDRMDALQRTLDAIKDMLDRGNGH